MRIDDRVGSIELHKPLRTMGVPARVHRLRFGDCAFMGHGPTGRVAVGVERKSVNEILGSMRDPRFAGRQLPGLITRYDHVWLVVEGYTTIDPASGCLMAGQWEAGFGPHRHGYASYKKYLLTLGIRAALHVECTRNFRETVHFLHALYGWWQKPWASHKSAYRVEQAEADRAILDERTVRRQMFAQIPAIGWVRSKRVSQYFPTIALAVAATEDQWREALGIAAGRVIVRSVMATLHGEAHGPAKGR